MTRTTVDLKARREARARIAAARAAESLSGNGLLRLPEVLSVYPVSRSGWFAGVASGQYPAPVKIGARAVAWRAADIRRLIEAAPARGVAA